VVTTTDYLPGHSEKLTINKVDGTSVTLNDKIKWPHNGVRYGGHMDRGREFTTRLPNRLQKTLAPDLLNDGAETRAAVALLSRSIRVVSAGDAAGEDFPAETSGYSYGAHMVIRQGFRIAQIQGVEFVQMGQGGRLGHYPVHFHMARQTPANTWVKDSSINESMTRWIVLHSTLGVTVQRNVGYKSIGHGFYLEDGTETDNKFYSNIGIFARAAVQNAQNPRRIPGILSTNEPGGFGFIHRSDSEFPSVFWITNGWNDFVGNMAAGAGACGAAYWFVPTENMGMAEVPGGSSMRWSGYAAMQGPGRGGTTPLKSFYMNYATSAMHSFQTTGDSPACNGVIAAGVTGQQRLPVMKAVESIAPRVGQDPMYYPRIQNLPNRSFCDVDKGEDCSTTPLCPGYGPGLSRCMVIVLDHFTTAFHWAEGAISAVWLRPKWHVLTNSVISDVQNGGLTFVTGGDYTRSSVVQGFWSLAKSSIFIGNTRDNTAYPFASNIGPFNKESGLKCEALPGNDVPGYCLNIDEGISMPATSFFTNQRLSNIYDGPSYQDSNAYLDIQTADCAKGYNNGCIYGSVANYLLLKRNPGQADSPCYLPNAAIGWKQPNGFYYPPAFHSRNLFFDNVDIRHFVIDPLFENDTAETTYVTDERAVSNQYCTSAQNIFGSNWTSIDRQTVLQDNDGSLTGLSNTEPAPPQGQPSNPLKQTFSINDDPFFEAPVEAPECASAIDSVLLNGSRDGNAEPANACNRPIGESPPATAKTSPYDYLSTVVSANIEEGWDRTCTDPKCYGVPLYRQYLTADEWTRWFKPDKPGTGCDQAGNQSTPECRWPMIRMAGADTGQRQTMTVNNGLYYLDTSVPEEIQQKVATHVNGFRKGRKYLVFFVYAKDTTRQTYQIYVGTKFDSTNFKPARVTINDAPVKYTELTGAAPWVTADYTQVATKGILTVTVDFRTEKSSLVPTPTNGVCQPQTFCRAAGNSCVNASLQGNPNKNFQTENSTVCSDWAVKDLDCPLGGCYGFSFELPKDGDFATGGYHRPPPVAFPTKADPKLQGKPDWEAKFERTQTDPDNNAPVAGQPNERKVDYPGRCYYQRVPFANCRH
jgi:cell migration-inducing and hyaluronan-binding protein